MIKLQKLATTQLSGIMHVTAAFLLFSGLICCQSAALATMTGSDPLDPDMPLTVFDETLPAAAAAVEEDAMAAAIPGNDNPLSFVDPEEPVDSDGDGIADENEHIFGTDPDNNDSDEDRIDDGFEVEFGLDPLDDDIDDDGLMDGFELTPDVDVANPLDVDGDGMNNWDDLDSDGDGIPDSAEAAIDSDNDGIPNFLDTDSDNDGIPDAEENGNGTDPNNPDSPDPADLEEIDQAMEDIEEFIDRYEELDESDVTGEAWWDEIIGIGEDFMEWYYEEGNSEIINEYPETFDDILQELEDAHWDTYDWPPYNNPYLVDDGSIII